MLHGDECTLVKGHSFVERLQINMIFPAALHILYLINFLLLLLVGGREGGYSFTACNQDCLLKYM